MKIRLATAMILAAMGFAQSALAQDAGQWIVRGGFHSLEPASHSHPSIGVEDTTDLVAFGLSIGRRF